MRVRYAKPYIVCAHTACKARIYLDRHFVVEFSDQGKIHPGMEVMDLNPFQVHVQTGYCDLHKPAEAVVDGGSSQSRPPDSETARSSKRRDKLP